MTTADWGGDECFMCNGTGRDRWPVTERRGIFEHVIGHSENGRPCRACNGHGRQPSMSEGETWSGENPTTATVSDARTGAWRGGDVVSIQTWTCATCTDNGRKGYCAPLRCYCGHETCHAFASWKPLAPPADVEPTKAERNAWSNRKESTWIDQL